jgi:hypothetical protein
MCTFPVSLSSSPPDVIILVFLASIAHVPSYPRIDLFTPNSVITPLPFTSPTSSSSPPRPHHPNLARPLLPISCERRQMGWDDDEVRELGGDG